MTSRQACVRNIAIAILNACNFLNPNPPNFFSTQRLPQVVHLMPLEPLLLPPRGGESMGFDFLNFLIYIKVLEVLIIIVPGENPKKKL